MDVKLVSWGTVTAPVAGKDCTAYRDRVFYLYSYLLNWNLLRVIPSLRLCHTIPPAPAPPHTCRLK